MLSEIELDILRYLTREVLEGLQMHSRYLRDRVNRNARSLPLRFIHSVDVIHPAFGSYSRKAEQETEISLRLVQQLQPQNRA